MEKATISMKMESPNPLFEKWLLEWLKEAKENNLTSQHTYSLALESLRKYPIPIKSADECKMLKGFGTKLCKKLEEKLKNNLDRPPDKKRKIEQEYIPAYKSGAYALIITLYRESLKENCLGYMTKNELILNAQPLCDSSFTKPKEPGSFYNAWSSMKTLISKSLVEKNNNPAKYSLSDEGKILGKRLYEENIRKKEETGLETYLPKTYDVLLYVDTCETGGSQNDPILSELTKLNVKFEVKKLDVGDYCWIFREKQSGSELVAPYIIERKRMDDLASSIKDGRFHEQKFRLKQCALPNVIYMIESYGKKDEHLGLPLLSLHQASVNTLIQDGFCVKFVEGTRGIAEYLSCMSDMIRKYYKNETEISSFVSFKDFNKLAMKSKAMTVKEMFVKHLLHIQGMSFDKAWAFVEDFSTPRDFVKFAKESDNVQRVISNIKCAKSGRKFGQTLSDVVTNYLTKDVL